MDPSYLSEDFLLHGKSARILYHDYAEKAPILDYHCHLSPRLIADDASFRSITELWLDGDHYKWRAMRASGIDERFITGDASDEDKFTSWSRTMPRAVRNPLYDWAHLELRRYFGVTDKLLSENTAAGLFSACNEQIRGKDFSARRLLTRMNVRAVCTTDDPADDLSWHDALNRDGFSVTMIPTFRPDKALAVNDPVSYNAYMDILARVTGAEISSFDGLLQALDKRHAYFHEHGCRSSDHGIESLSAGVAPASELNTIFLAVRSGKAVSEQESLQFKTGLLLELLRMNHSRGWVQQLHCGVIRNARDRVFKSLGADAGVDCMGDFLFARPLSGFLDALDKTNQLAKTVLFNSNSCDNELFACIASTFSDGSSPGKIQYGPAWWFLDQKDGIIRHLDVLSCFGLLGLFIGMTTDSRSLLSFPRHEYFRRILCNRLGEEIDSGDLPGDMALLGKIVQDVCYSNAKSYFDFRFC